MKHFLSIILPSLSDGDNLAEIIPEILQLSALKDKSLEFIVIEDGRPMSDSQLLKMRSLPCHFTYINNLTRQGLARSLLTGIYLAQAEHVLVMDCDFNHDVHLIPKIVQQLSVHDFVSASRYLGAGNMPGVLRGNGGRVMNIFLKSILDLTSSDVLYGFFAIRKELLLSLPLEKIFNGHGDYFFHLLFFLQEKNALGSEIPACNGIRRHGHSSFRPLANFLRYSASAFSLYLQEKRQPLYQGSTL